MINKRHDSNKRLGAFAPAGGVHGDQFLRIGAVFGCAVSSVAAGERFALETRSGYEVKVAAVTNPIGPGTAIYWKANRAVAEFHNDKTDGILVGHAALDIPAVAVAAGQTGVIEVFVVPIVHAADPADDGN